MKFTRNRPLYSIGVVSELLDVHPETVRSWERSGVFQPPQRRSGKRFYSENDFRRLQFIQKLVGEGLTLRAIQYYLRLYPCWKNVDCPGCINGSDQSGSSKPCWQEAGTFCQVASSDNPCANCPNNKEQELQEAVDTKQGTTNSEQSYGGTESDSFLEAGQR